MNTMNSDTDRIERSIRIEAPRERVWRALTTAEQFGQWFGANLAGQTFAAGQRTRGPLTISGYEERWFDVTVERIEPTHHFSYRWHPACNDVPPPTANEPPTLVSFTLQDVGAGATLLTVVETGFDAIPPERRLSVFRGNTRGWEFQLGRIAHYAQAN